MNRFGFRLVGPIASVALAGAVALAAAAPAQGATDPVPGTYKGKVKGGTVSLKVKPTMRARLSYSLKPKCGRARGTVTLKIRNNGRFRTTGKGRFGSAKGRFVAEGKKARGTLSRPIQGRRTAGSGCKAGARRFTARLANGTAGGGGAAALELGHYAGSNAAGKPVSFDLVDGPGGPAIENFAADVETECWDDYNGDGLDDLLIARITGFGGEVTDEGAFDIYYAPDDDTEFEFSGTIDGGQATMDITVGGHFNPDGTPNLIGLFECDSWGDRYDAVRVG